MNKKLETVFLECPICNFLNEVDASIVNNNITVKNAYGAEVVRTIQKTEELVLCEDCGTALWPKEYAPKKPKIFTEKPKKRLTSKKKKSRIPPSNIKNEDIEKK
mgnify:CR=1 FL=1